MTNNKYYSPILGEGQFHCPNCGVYAKQLWAHLHAKTIWGDDVVNRNTNFNEQLNSKWRITQCEHCNEYIIWLEDSIIYPDKITVDTPNQDLSDDIKKDYVEAAEIFNKSPRGAAAILRLSLQKLLKQLGEKGEKINDDIKSLIKKGLNPTIQKALDFVRVTGNNAVHPGQINLEDNKDIALNLFKIINFIAEKMITEPKEVEELFESLPEDEKKKIEDRDNTII